MSSCLSNWQPVVILIIKWFALKQNVFAETVYLDGKVESIVLSIISMLSSPNDESPVNVEAAKEWRDNKDQFRKKVSRCVRKSQEMM
ncbi:hypothetical protein QQ045_004808 [Rhodiola kirilowii]